MGIRINKVCNELNIGLQTIVDFLKNHDELGVIRDDVTPNSKISDEQYDALVKKFGGDKWVKEKAEKLFGSINERKKKTKVSKPDIASEKKIVLVGKVDLNVLAKQSQTSTSDAQPLDGFDWDTFESSANIGEVQDDDIFIETDHTIVTGTVISIDRREVVVNIGYKRDGIIPASEFRYNPKLKIGDQVEVYVEDSKFGRLILSHKKARLSRAWDQINKALDNQETITGYVKTRTKGGLIVDVYGIEAFLPSSHIDIIKIYNQDEYVGKTIGLKVIKVNEEFRNVVVSRKAVVQENIEKQQSDKTLLKDIWQKHTEVQEQILRQRTSPIVILPHLTTIINDKLHVRVDTSDNTELLKSKIVESLELNEDDCHFDDGYVYASIDKWAKLDERTKSKISSKANSEYVTFTFYPVVDGKITDKKAQFTEIKSILDKLEIEYDFDKMCRLQISLNDLQKLRENEEFTKMDISLPEKASAVIQTYPSILTFLERLCPNHNIENIEIFQESRGAASEAYINKHIIVHGGYLKQEILDVVNPIFNLKMFKVEFVFKLNESAIKKYNWKKNEDGLPEQKNGCIIFKRDVKINKEEEYESDEMDDVESQSLSSNVFRYINRRPTVEDVNLEYSLIKRGLDRIFGKGQYHLEDERYYYYYYRENRNWATAEELDSFNDRIHAEIKNTDELRVQSNGLSIGVDFCWKQKSLVDILSDLSSKYPFIDFSLFKKGHKCKFDIKYKKANLTGLMEDLHNTFEDLTIELVGKGTELHFCREFQSYDELAAFKLQLNHKLSTFDKNRYNCIIHETPADKVKLVYFNDRVSREEEQQAAARELKGAEFKVGDLSIGKLIRVSNYPELVFDISGYNFFAELPEKIRETCKIKKIS